MASNDAVDSYGGLPWIRSMSERLLAQNTEKVAFLTRPTPARREAPFTERRSRVALKKRER
jgi:hypothetical protein